MAFGVRLRVYGPFARFPGPGMVDASCSSYDVMTPIAARGVLEAIHWKPAIRWVVDEIAVLKPIRRESLLPAVLTDVDYVISAHFRMTGRAGAGDNEGKHLDMFTRRAQQGKCFQQPSLGTRQFDARFVLMAEDAPMPEPDEDARTAELGFGTPRDLGLMLWDIDHDAPGRPSMFFRAKLENGIMKVPASGSTDASQL